MRKYVTSIFESGKSSTSTQFPLSKYVGSQAKTFLILYPRSKTRQPILPQFNYRACVGNLDLWMQPVRSELWPPKSASGKSTKSLKICECRRSMDLGMSGGTPRTPFPEEQILALPVPQESKKKACFMPKRGHLRNSSKLETSLFNSFSNPEEFCTSDFKFEF